MGGMVEDSCRKEIRPHLLRLMNRVEYNICRIWGVSPIYRICCEEDALE